jgi:hypothetical protein
MLLNFSVSVVTVQVSSYQPAVSNKGNDLNKPII